MLNHSGEAAMKTRDITFGKHEAVEILHGSMKIVVVTDMGPRLAFFGPAKGKNLLFWDPMDRYRRGNWLLKGGHRVWTTRPGADESEESYAEDNGRVAVTAKSGSVTFTGQTHPLFRIQKGFTLRPAGNGSLWVDNFVVNRSDMLWSGGVWALTCTLPLGGATYGIPLGDGSEWDSFNVAAFRSWGGGHTSLVNDPQMKWGEDMLVVTPKGREAKRALFIPTGLIGMRAPRGNCSFFKAVRAEKGASYPCGCNVAFYIGPGNFMVEMETMSPEATLKPGERLVNSEKWLLTKALDWKNGKAIRALARTH
jgi:hypothetical protein